MNNTLIDIKNKILKSKVFKSPETINPLERRIVLKNYQVIDPLNIEEYIARDGYFALEKALRSTEIDIVNEVMTSNLRGRGGVGFPTGLKWKFTKQNNSKDKYIICNADEGEPGTFMDKHILEGDPHSVIEGMIIAGYAIGANKGYIYLRAEYPEALDILNHAIDECHQYNLLGENILDSSFSFDLEVRKGAGAFICGEETSLLESIEGNRGESRNKPPYPASKGLFNKPTSVNNVETLACVPHIILKGGLWYKNIGTENSSGTKVFSLAGKIKNPGIYEVEFGMTMKDIIDKLGGGMKEGSTFNYVVSGGPSSGFLFKEHLNLVVDFDSLIEYGAMMGSGGIIIFDQDDCLMDTLKVFMKFNEDESCGKCTPCREGTGVLSLLIAKLASGEGEESDIEILESLGKIMAQTSLCGLGQAAPTPIFSALRYKKDIFINHIDKGCKLCNEGSGIDE